MFSLLQSNAPLGFFDLAASDFDRDYPKESFDTDDPNNSPLESVLHYCCGVIHESGCFRFRLDAGGEHIDLPINPELSIFLAQFAKLVSFLRDDSRETQVDFYEQGYEIEIQFSKSENSVTVHTQWKVDRRTLRRQVSHEEINASVSRFLLDFLTAVAHLTPAILREPAFEKWFSETLLSPAHARREGVSVSDNQQ